MRRYAITMLGSSGSGKTAYMIGLYRAMGAIGLRLESKDRVRFNFNGSMQSQARTLNWFREHDFIKTNYKFPPGTSSPSTWNFELQWNGNEEAIAEWDWMDYRGGIFDDNVDSLSTGKPQEEIEARLRLTDAIIIVVDSIWFSRDLPLSDIKSITDVDAIELAVRSVFGGASKEREQYPRAIIFVITKVNSNLVPNEFRSENYKLLRERIDDVFGGILDIARHWVPAKAIRVAAVDVGMPGEVVDEVATNASGLGGSIKSIIKPPLHGYRCEVPILACFSILLDEERRIIRERWDSYRNGGLPKEIARWFIDIVRRQAKSPTLDDLEQQLLLLENVARQLDSHVSMNVWSLSE